MTQVHLILKDVPSEEGVGVDIDVNIRTSEGDAPDSPIGPAIAVYALIKHVLDTPELMRTVERHFTAATGITLPEEYVALTSVKADE